MKKRLDVTLVTPVKNEIDSIGQVVSRVQSLDTLPSMWILCDNGSTDGTREWIQGNTTTLDFPVVVLYLPKMTIAAMLNAAIQTSESRIIAICHAGTLIPSNWLKVITTPLYENPQLHAVGTIWHATGTTTFENWLAACYPSNKHATSAYNFLPASRSLAFTKAAWQAVGGFPEWLPRFGEDTLFDIRLAETFGDFPVLNSVSVGWRPQSSIRRAINQYIAYEEANGLLGFIPKASSYVLHPWIHLLPAVIVALAAAPKWGIFYLVATATAEIFVFRKNRPNANISHYLFWFWLMKPVRLMGLIKGVYSRKTKQINLNERDLQFVSSYCRKANAHGKQ